MGYTAGQVLLWGLQQAGKEGKRFWPGLAKQKRTGKVGRGALSKCVRGAWLRKAPRLQAKGFASISESEQSQPEAQHTDRV